MCRKKHAAERSMQLVSGLWYKYFEFRAGGADFGGARYARGRGVLIKNFRVGAAKEAVAGPGKPR